jgi:peptidylprolyl isomerase
MQPLMRKNVTALTALLILAALALTACGSDAKDSRDSAAQPSSAAPTPDTTATESDPSQPSKPASPEGKITKDLKEKPEIPKPSGSPPSKLESEDIVEGKGKAAKEGDKVSVQYVGVAFSTGTEFDASWERGKPFDFTLGAGEVIPGWDQGVVGMKEGGRRQLTIPAELAYGAQGSPPAIGPNETLVFVIDMVKIG